MGPIIAATIIKRVHNKDVVYFFQSHNRGYQIITKLYLIYIHNRKSWTWPIYLFCEMYVSIWYWNIKIERYFKKDNALYIYHSGHWDWAWHIWLQVFSKLHARKKAALNVDRTSSFKWALTDYNFLQIFKILRNFFKEKWTMPCIKILLIISTSSNLW